jgi:hypothetical protein
MFFSLRRFFRRLRAMALSSADDTAAVSEDDRRPWEPPFDASKPAPPISYPITDLAALASRSYLSEASNFHLPFNRASTPLPCPGAPLPARRRLLVCHDMQGGYGDDAAPQGGANPDAYALWHWHLMDVFVYFSHYLVTLPPPCWTNAAHLHGVKVSFSHLPPPMLQHSQLQGLACCLTSPKWTCNSTFPFLIQGFGNVHHRVGERRRDLQGDVRNKGLCPHVRREARGAGCCVRLRWLAGNASFPLVSFEFGVSSEVIHYFLVKKQYTF